MPKQAPKKVLIIRFSSIGDIVLTSPVVRCLKAQRPNCEIHYVTKKANAIILSSNPNISKVHLLDERGWSALVQDLKKENFDFVVDLHKSLRSLRLKLALRKPYSTFSKLNIQKMLLVSLKWDFMPDLHIVDRYMAALKPLGVKNDAKGLDYFIPDKDEVELSWLHEDFHRGFYALAIGAQHATKRLPLHKLVELCCKIKQPIVLMGGKDDSATAELIIEKVYEQKQENPGLYEKLSLFNACGKFNLNQSASLLKLSKGVFTHDTGLMHIASALKKRVFSIWGSTVPAFGMYPYLTPFVIIENRNLGCRPCSKIGYEKCPLGHFKCMNDIQFEFGVLD